MTLLAYAQHKYPAVKSEPLLEALAGVEAFNPNLPNFVTKEHPQSTHSYRKMMRRATRKHGEKNVT